MAFDRQRYQRDYLAKQDAKRGLTDDIISRYAIDLSASEAEVGRQVRDVRAYWNGFKPGTRFADVAALCRSADERLRAEFGEQMLQKAWWSEQPTQSGESSELSRVDDLLVQGQLGAARWAAHGLSLSDGRIAATVRVSEERKRLDSELSNLQARLDADDQVQKAISAAEAAVEKERRLLSIPARPALGADQWVVQDSSGFGIDLGATYAAVAYIDDNGRPIVARNELGYDTTPSVLYFEDESHVVVGVPAKEMAVVMPDSVVSLIRRELGNTDYVLEFYGREYTAPALSALILRRLIQGAQADTGRTVERAVIAVPAYFGMLEKARTHEAAKLAGIKVIELISEPVAAALACGIGFEDRRTVVVYDLGGSTFDVAVVRFSDDAARILALDGERRLGGSDWDAALVDHILSEVTAQLGDDSIRDDDIAIQEIWNQAENAKQQLSQVQSRKVIVRHNGRAVKVEITRAQLEEMTKHLLDRTIEITHLALEALDEKYPEAKAQISDVLLVGGSSRMPAVAEALKREFGWDAKLSDPDLAVAKGAAIFGALPRIIEDAGVARSEGGEMGLHIVV